MENRQAFKETLSELIALSNNTYEDLDSCMDAYLAFGLEKTGFQTGIVSRIVENDYAILAIKSSNPTLKKGMHFDLATTFCRETVATQKPLYCSSTTGTPLEKIPAKEGLNIESVICVPLFVEEQIFGTLNLSSSEAVKDHAKWEILRNVIELLGQSLAKDISIYQARQISESKSKELERLSICLVR